VAQVMEKRVEVLEESYGGGGECPECGGPIPWDMALSHAKVVWRGRTSEADAQDEWCSTCGRPLVIVLRWKV
jgi:hypothetical protein